MVNLNFHKFNKLQKQHKSSYIGSDKEQKTGVNDSKYNNQFDTDKAIGATGRDVLGED